MEIYTNSMFKDWKLCKIKYYFKYIKKILIPQKEDNFVLGKKVHALISYKLNGFSTSKMEQNLDDEILLHYRSILNHRLLKQDHFLSEWGFSVQIGQTKNLFNGRIDAVFYDKNTNTYTIADWKTGMKIPENPLLDEQAKIYLYSFFKCQKDIGIKINPENLSFVFVQTPSLNESSLKFSEELLQKFEEDFVDTTTQIEKFSLPHEKPDNKNCKFCEYKFICEKNFGSSYY